MKKIAMNVYRCDDDGWQEAGTKTFERASRWMRVKHNYNPTKRNALWDYVMDGDGHYPYQSEFDPSKGLFLEYFTFGGRNYAIEQFLALGNPFYAPMAYMWQEGGKQHRLSGIDAEDLHDPIYIELENDGESVRVYKEIDDHVYAPFWIRPFST